MGVATTTGQQRFFAFHLEKTKKGVFRQNTRDTGGALLGKHVVGNDNHVVLRKLVRQRVGIDRKGKGEEDTDLEHPVAKHFRDSRQRLAEGGCGGRFCGAGRCFRGGFTR